jgi:hypothetical protein
MAAVAPSGFNTFVPDHDATNKLVIDFARNQKDFAVNKYAQIIPCKAVTGWYLKMTVEEAGRILDTNLDDVVWPDGNAAPEFENETETFEFLPFRTRRYAWGFNLGALTAEQASWDIVAQHASIKARRALTARTQKVVTALTTTANYDSSHLMDVRAISGNSGKWSESTTARQDVKRSLQTALELISDDTLDAVSQDDMILVINSALAAALSQTQEIVDYIKGSPDALAQVRGELPGGNVRYGLPGKLYGVPLVVEGTRKVTSKRGATTARSQVLPTANAVLCSRPGGLVGVEGSPSFSSVAIFAQEEMTTERKTDADNRRVVARIVENYDVKLIAPAATVLFSYCA